MNSSILNGRYLPLNSPIHRLNGTVKLAVFLLFAAATAAAKSLVGFGLLSAILIGCLILSQMDCRLFLKGLRQVWSFLLLILLLNAFFNDTQAKGNILWQFWIFHLSLSGIFQGLRVIIKIILLMGMADVLMVTTTPMQLTAAMEKLLSPLRFIDVPVKELALMTGIALQFIPILAEENQMIIRAQTARGARLNRCGWRGKARSALPFFIPVFICAFRRADELADAMEARGYHGTETSRQIKQNTKEKKVKGKTKCQIPNV